MLISSLCAFIATSFQFSNEESAWYLEYPKGDESLSYLVTWIKNIFVWVLIFTNFVPISLLVTIEMVKFGQKTIMEYDYQMFDYQK